MSNLKKTIAGNLNVHDHFQIRKIRERRNIRYK